MLLPWLMRLIETHAEELTAKVIQALCRGIGQELPETRFPQLSPAGQQIENPPCRRGGSGERMFQDFTAGGQQPDTSYFSQP